MAFLLEGIKVGLVLALMVGPLFFTLIQTGVEEGFRAGAAVGLGIWASDLLYIVAVYSGVAYLVQFVEKAEYTTWIGVAGSILLAIFGLAALLVTPKNLYIQDDTLRISGARNSSYLALWLKGFLINTINPFTIFFWMGLMSTVVVQDNLQTVDARFYFSGIIGVVILSDLLKVLLAKSIRRIMRPIHLIWMRKISGVALLVFGAALFIRVVF